MDAMDPSVLSGRIRMDGQIKNLSNYEPEAPLKLKQSDAFTPVVSLICLTPFMVNNPKLEKTIYTWMSQPA